MEKIEREFKNLLKDDNTIDKNVNKIIKKKEENDEKIIYNHKNKLNEEEKIKFFDNNKSKEEEKINFVKKHSISSSSEWEDASDEEEFIEEDGSPIIFIYNLSIFFFRI